MKTERVGHLFHNVHGHIGANPIDEPIHIEATPEEVSESLFNGPPKPRNQWRFLKNGTPGKKEDKHKELDQSDPLSLKR